jgi:integrase
LYLKSYVHEPIGNVPIQKVNRNTILETCGLRKIWDVRTAENPDAKPEVAKRVRMLFTRLFNFAIARGYYHGENPAKWEDGLKDTLPEFDDIHKLKHHASLPYQRAPEFMHVLRTYKPGRRGPGVSRSALWRHRHYLPKPDKARPITALALEFIVLTGVRISEVLLAAWKEFDLDQIIWTVPPEHKKNKKESRAVPITTHMLAVLEEVQKRRTSQSPDALVFPSSACIGAPLWRSTIYQFVQRSLKLDVEITVHGFRSTLKDWCRANRFPMVWYEIQVDHALGNKVDQAYGPDPLIDSVGA